MSRAAGTAPVLIDATLESSVPGGPIGGQSNLNLPNDHFAYIGTW